MKILAISLAIFIVLAAPLGAGAARGFTGSWESIDTDGSWQKMSISGGGDGVYHVHILDHYASSCGIGQNRPAMAVLTMTSESVNTLDGDLTYYCLRPREFLTDAHLTLVWDPATDTVYDGWVTWHRVEPRVKPS